MAPPILVNLAHGSWVHVELEEAAILTVVDGKPATFKPTDGFDQALKNAYRGRDGRLVGIFQRGGIAPESRGKKERIVWPPHVQLVDAEGRNLRVQIPGQVMSQSLCVPVGSLSNLGPVRDREDIPRARIAARLEQDPGWQPKAHYDA